MDISQFRESGELSDITVVVDGKEFQLHKFPLYTHSVFFKEKAQHGEQSDQGASRIQLEDFPGGSATFQEVADFCYNKRLIITPENACLLRCAAEYLQMNSGVSNLAGVTDRQINDVLTSSKISRDVYRIVEFLLSCASCETLAQKAGIVDACTQAVVDCWLISSSIVPSRSGVYDLESARPGSLEKKNCLTILSKMPLDWFTTLFVKARDRNVKTEILSSIVQGYIYRMVAGDDDYCCKESVQEIIADQLEEVGEVETKDKSDAAETKSDDEGEEDDDDDANKSVNKKLDEDERNSEEHSRQDEAQRAAPTAGQSEEQNFNQEHLGKLIKILLKEIPSYVSLSDTISPEWALKMLQTCEKLTPESRENVLELSARVAHKFTAEQLGTLAETLIEDLIACATKDDRTIASNKEILCDIVYRYLQERVEHDNIDVAVTCRLVNSVKGETKEHSTKDDILYDVVEKILTAEKVEITDKEKEELLGLVSCEHLDEETLQRAHDAGLLPQEQILAATLARCAALREELNDARDLVRAQQQQLDKYGLRAAAGQRDNGLCDATGLSGQPYCTYTPPPSRYDSYCDTTHDHHSMFSYEPSVSSISYTYTPLSSLRYDTHTGTSSRHHYHHGGASYTTTSVADPPALSLITAPISRRFAATKNRRAYRFS